MKHNSVWGKLLLLALSFVLAFSTLVSCTKDDVAALDKETDEIKTSLSTTAEDLANLKTLVNSIKATADAAAAKTALDAAIKDIEALKTSADAAATAEALAGVKAELETALAGKLDAAVKAELQTAIDAVKTTADAAATKAALEEAEDALAAAIAGKADATALAAAQTAIDAVKATADAAATKAALEEAEDALAAAIAGKADATDLAALEAKLAEYAKAADVAALQVTLTSVKTQVDGLATDVDTLEVKVAALEAAIKGKADAEAFQAQLDAVKASIATLSAAIKAPVDSDGYKATTEMLMGEGKYSLKAWEAKVAAVSSENFTADVFKNFEADVAIYKLWLLRATSVENDADVNGLAYWFAQLDARIAAMPTFKQTFELYVNKFENDEANLVAPSLLKDGATNADYDNMVNAYGKAAATLDAEGADKKLVDTYNVIVAAYTKLVEADNEANGVNTTIVNAVADITTKTFVLYNTANDEAIKAGEKAYADFVVAYFTYAEGETDLTVYYATKANELIESYETLVDYRARYTTLTAAAEVAPKINGESVKALNYNTVRALYTSADAFAEKLAAIKAWSEEAKWNGNIEAENIAIIYTVETVDQYELLTKASAYADAMNAIYNEKVVDVELAKNINALVEKTTVFYADKDIIEDCEEAVVALKAALGGVADYSADDGNFEAMLPNYDLADDAFDFVAISARLDELDEAKAKLVDIYNAMVALVAANKATDVEKPVTFNDSYAIKAWEAEIASIYASVDVEMKAEDANFVAMEKTDSATAKLAELKAEYEKLVKAIREMYENITAALGEDGKGTKMSLTLGLRLGDYNALIATIPTDTNDINLNLDDDDENKVSFSDLMTKLVEANSKYKKLAAQAQTDAKAVIALITGDFATLATDTLNNYNAIIEVRDALKVWLETYMLGTMYAVEFDENGLPTKYVTVDSLESVVDVKAALAAIANVPVAGTAGAEKYIFVDVANYEACVTKYDAIVAFRALADDEWKKLEKYFAPLTDNATQTPSNDIHNLPKYSDDNFLAYIGDYYGDIADMANIAIVVINPVNDEINAYNEFKASWNRCYANDDAAEGDRLAIHNAITGLAAPNALNYQDVLDAINEDIVGIRALIEAYYENYCPKKCASCITAADLLLLEKRAAVAEVVKYAEEEVRVNAITPAANAKIDEIVDFYASFINDNATSASQATSFIGQAKSQFAKDCPCLVVDDPLDPKDVHTYGDDCVCDYCGYTKACVDAEDDQDHKCDVCGTDGINVCADATNDGDHKCDVCGADGINGCADATNDGDHKCDECGKADVTTCADGDTDAKCDDCGADMPHYE